MKNTKKLSDKVSFNYSISHLWKYIFILHIMNRERKVVKQYWK